MDPEVAAPPRQIYSLDDANLPRRETNNYHRQRSSSQEPHHHFSIPKSLHNFTSSRSLDALDGNVEHPKENGSMAEQQEQLTLKKSTSGSSDSTELIAPAPESSIDENPNDDDFVDEELDHIETGGGGGGGGAVRSVRFSSVTFGGIGDIDASARSKISDIDGSGRSNGSGSKRPSRQGSRRGSISRSISQVFIPMNEGSKRASLTAQRYGRQAQSVFQLDLSNISKDDISEDTWHRLKNVACCLIFAFFTSVLLYFMLRP